MCNGNPLYYTYCSPLPTIDNILEDMIALPPNVNKENKYYIGFYDADKLIAVMDLITGYPQKGIAFIGFFMTDKSLQGKGVGSTIIEKACEYFKTVGFTSVRLAWVKGNPQAEHFWTKNNFIKMKETSSTNEDEVILAQRILN